MASIYEDPDYEGFNGIYVGSPNGKPLPKNDMDLSGLAAYLRETGKEYKDLTKEEIDKFKFK